MHGSVDRYARQRALPGFGDQAQQLLQQSSVLLVGLGGLGSPAAQYLAGAGIGHLIINDFDVVNESNLHRQTLFGHADIGVRKPAAAANRLVQINPEVRLTVIDERLDLAALKKQVANVDLVVDGTDNFATRESINRACVSHARTLVSGAAAGTDGQIGVYPCDRDGPCYHCFYDDLGDNLADCEGGGVLGPVTGVIGCLMALEAIKVITRFGRPLAGRLLAYDGLNGHWKSVKLKRKSNCAACGTGNES